MTPRAVRSILFASLLVMFCGVLHAAAFARPSRFATSSPIAHVVILVQMGRSLDNLFHSFPGADTASSGRLCNGTQLKLAAVPLQAPVSIGHTFEEQRQAIQRGCFDAEPVRGHYHGLKYPQYGYVPARETGIYFTAARNYVVADKLFASTMNPAFETLQYLIAAQASDALDDPVGDPNTWGCDSKPGTFVLTFEQANFVAPCFDYTTLADELDKAGLTWRYYVPGAGEPGREWSAFDAIRHIRNGPDWQNVVSPETTILSDVNNGRLGSVTWVLPNAVNSDETGWKSSTGPSWVQAVANAVGESKYWSSSAIVVLWAGYGGWFDHVMPPALDVEGLGFRNPMLVISPYAKRGSVAHTQYETSSILRFIENNFGLQPMSMSDSRATPLGPDIFDFNQAPRAFKPL